MRCLEFDEANRYLSQVGMEIGEWNQISDVKQLQRGESAWVNYRAPERSRELYVFSQYVAGWLPKGHWKIFQIDNSTSLSLDESNFFFHLMGVIDCSDLEEKMKRRTFLFESVGNDWININTELLIANLIYAFLLFECHGYVVSSGSSTGRRIGIQDGFVYFISRENDKSSAEALIGEFELHPLTAPQWVSDI